MQQNCYNGTHNGSSGRERESGESGTGGGIQQQQDCGGSGTTVNGFVVVVGEQQREPPYTHAVPFGTHCVFVWDSQIGI